MVLYMRAGASPPVYIGVGSVGKLALGKMTGGEWSE